MNKYESVIILQGDLTDEKVNEVINKFENYINENGNLEKTENIGKKKLAYEIKKNKEGHYVIFYFEAEFGFIAELERIYRITDEIIKFIVVKMEG